jgi:hypothetical protein
LAINASVMTPIVFCASFVPCESATSDALAICPTRKLRLVSSGSRRRMRR